MGLQEPRCCFLCSELSWNGQEPPNNKKSTYRAGSCPASAGVHSGSVPRQKERFFLCIPASIPLGAQGWGRGATRKLSLSLFMGHCWGLSPGGGVCWWSPLGSSPRPRFHFSHFPVGEGWGVKELKTCCWQLRVKIKVHFSSREQSISNLCDRKDHFPPLPQSELAGLGWGEENRFFNRHIPGPEATFGEAPLFNYFLNLHGDYRKLSQDTCAKRYFPNSVTSWLCCSVRIHNFL